MKKLGFKNFRRFVALAPLELGEITLMVGKNNSGKSTLVKALLLILDYLRNQQGETFSFANESLNDANIVTFERAKCKSTDTPQIEFSFEIEKFTIEISISGESQYTTAHVDFVKIHDSYRGLDIIIDYQKDIVSVERLGLNTDKPISIEQAKNEIESEIQKYKKELKEVSKTSKEGLQLINSINKLSDRLKNIQPFIIEEKEEIYKVEYPLVDNSDIKPEESAFNEIIRDFLAKNHDMRVYYIGKNSDGELSEEEKVAFDEVSGIDGARNMIRTCILELNSTLNTKKVFYLGANPSKQSALFNLRDKENALGQAIHQFYQLKIEKGEKEYRFVEYWMAEFEIGSSFEIKFISGEAYECHIINDDVKTHLADMGMGSLQLMQLFFKIATMLRLYKSVTKGINLIVEEPELNLHPSLQSKLADFFYKVNDKHGIKFIIETHSEYIIRSSQVIGLENDLFTNQETNPNPFKVYYFHIKEGPYEMSFDSRGRFEKEFGEGFTDVSRKLTRKLL